MAPAARVAMAAVRAGQAAPAAQAGPAAWEPLAARVVGSVDKVQTAGPVELAGPVAPVPHSGPAARVGPAAQVGKVVPVAPTGEPEAPGVTVAPEGWAAATARGPQEVGCRQGLSARAVPEAPVVQAATEALTPVGVVVMAGRRVQVEPGAGAVTGHRRTTSAESAEPGDSAAAGVSAEQAKSG